MDKSIFADAMEGEWEVGGFKRSLQDNYYQGKYSIFSCVFHDKSLHMQLQVNA